MVKIGKAMVLEKLKAFLLAYTLGKISPKKRIKKVITPISINSTIKGFSIWLNRSSPKEANKRTIAILIKLLVISMVAKRRFGFWSIFWIISICRDLFSSSESSNSLVKEKKATSAPETSPEVSNNNTRKMI